MKDVVYADEQDRPVGSGTINEAITNGKALRIVRVFIANKKGELLLQQRSGTSYSSPGKWDQSAGGHVDVGESYEQSAYRELAEEMGIIDIKLAKVDKFYTEDMVPDLGVRRRHNVIFVGSYDSEVKPNEQEVSDYKWISVAELNSWLKNFPEDFTNGFRMAYKRYLRII